MVLESTAPMNIGDIQYTVVCVVRGSRRWSKPQVITFNLGSQLQSSVQGILGPVGISDVAADLLDFSSAIFQIERLLRRRGINRPEHFDLKIKLRKPEIWNASAIEITQNILHLLGNATWELSVYPGLDSATNTNSLVSDFPIEQVALFSGGMDSSCGIATLCPEASQTQLVSFYSTHQKEVQAQIASQLGFRPPTQWRLHWTGDARPGGTFYFRSFFFLSLAAVVANSWNIRKIYQFENGVLASAIPPDSTWMMTKHAHPELHRLSANLFAGLFGDTWQIVNPFLPLTKRGCVQVASRVLSTDTVYRLMQVTETCWYHWSNRIPGGEKKPGRPCGICVPCIIRRTAIPEGNYEYDLVNDEQLRNLRTHNLAFQSYFNFARHILKTNDEYEFYNIIPSSFEFIDNNSALALEQLYRLFRTFAEEFVTAYKLESIINGGST